MAAYTRCLRCAGAPRRPASGSGLSLSILSWHTVLSDPGEFDHRQFQRSDVDTAFAESRPARHSQTPAIRFTRAMTFVASWFTHLLRSASLLAPCTDLTGYPASGAFTSGLSAGWSPFPLQDITTTATGTPVGGDSHPLEWQLASLHLLLHRDGLAPSTPCRSPGALRYAPVATTAAK